MSYNSRHIYIARCGAGPATLLLHGLPSTHTLWAPVTPLIAPCRTVLAADMPGFGASPAPDDPADFALHTTARLMLDALEPHLHDDDDDGHRRFHLVGHSYGAAVAVALAALAPHRIRSLTLITPLTDLLPTVPALAATGVGVLAAGLWSLLRPQARRQIILRGARLTYGEAFTAARAEQIVSEQNTPHLMHTIARLLHAYSPSHWRACARRVQDSAAFPVLLVGAMRDHVVPFPHFRRLCTLMPRARRFVFAGAGHVPIWQFPDSMARLITGKTV